MFKKSVTLFTAGLMMAGMIAGTAAGSIGAMAAEKTSEAEARDIAVSDAGLSQNEVNFDRVEIGTEQGASVYEIEFRSSAVEYDYDIAIADGEIVKESWEIRRPSAQGSRISEAEARTFALNEAGINEQDVTFTRIENGHEDGIAVYEVDFESVEAVYEYDIAKDGGRILSGSRKVKVPACVAKQEKANADANTGKTGREAAIDAALSHAGFSADEVSGLRCEKDYDDGREIYDVEFRQGGFEYSYDIDANNYSIIEWDKDYDD